MTFNEFAQMLYPYIGNGETKSKFIIFLTDQIIEEPQDRNMEQLNPLSRKGPSVLEKYYRGSTKITKADAGAILTNSSKYQFENYLLTIEPNRTISIGKAMKEKGVMEKGAEITVDKVATTCANLFLSILEDLATRVSKPIEFLVSSIDRKGDVVSLTENTSLPKNESEAISQKRHKSTKLYKGFVEVVEYYKIMDIINRKPAILNREDTARFSLCVEPTIAILDSYAKKECGHTTLYANIKMFTHALRIQTLSVTATLNRRFDPSDETASVNMEEDNSAESNERPDQIKLLRLYIDNIPIDNEVYEPDDDFDDEGDDTFDFLTLGEMAVGSWGSFRDKMNLLYERIKGSL